MSSEDEEGNHARFVGKLVAEPARADEKPADEKAEDADGASQRKHGGEIEVESAEHACRRKKAYAESAGDVIQRDERKGAEAPEDKGMGEARAAGAGG